MPNLSILQRALGTGSGPADPYGTATWTIKHTLEWALSDEQSGKMSEGEFANLQALQGALKELDPHA